MPDDQVAIDFRLQSVRSANSSPPNGNRRSPKCLCRSVRALTLAIQKQNLFAQKVSAWLPQGIRQLHTNDRQLLANISASLLRSRSHRSHWLSSKKRCAFCFRFHFEKFVRSKCAHKRCSSLQRQEIPPHNSYGSQNRMCFSDEMSNRTCFFRGTAARMPLIWKKNKNSRKIPTRTQPPLMRLLTHG